MGWREVHDGYTSKLDESFAHGAAHRPKGLQPTTLVVPTAIALQLGDQAKGASAWERCSSIPVA